MTAELETCTASLPDEAQARVMGEDIIVFSPTVVASACELADPAEDKDRAETITP